MFTGKTFLLFTTFVVYNSCCLQVFLITTVVTTLLFTTFAVYSCCCLQLLLFPTVVVYNFLIYNFCCLQVFVYKLFVYNILVYNFCCLQPLLFTTFAVYNFCGLQLLLFPNVVVYNFLNLQLLLFTTFCSCLLSTSPAGICGRGCRKQIDFHKNIQHIFRATGDEIVDQFSIRYLAVPSIDSIC